MLVSLLLLLQYSHTTEVSFINTFSCYNVLNKIKIDHLTMILKVTFKKYRTGDVPLYSRGALTAVEADRLRMGTPRLLFQMMHESHQPCCPMEGVKNADENELQEIASEPDSTHVYNVAEFDLMHTVVESLTRTVCSRVEEQDREIKGNVSDREPSFCACGHSLEHEALVGYETSHHK